MHYNNSQTYYSKYKEQFNKMERQSSYIVALPLGVHYALCSSVCMLSLLRAYNSKTESLKRWNLADMVPWQSREVMLLLGQKVEVNRVHYTSAQYLWASEGLLITVQAKSHTFVSGFMGASGSQRPLKKYWRLLLQYIYRVDAFSDVYIRVKALKTNPAGAGQC